MKPVRKTLVVLAALCTAVTCAGPAVLAPSEASAAPNPSAPGYWLAASDGGVFAFGVPFFGSGASPGGPCTFSPQPPSTLNGAFGCGAIAATPGGDGYWLLNVSRFPTAFGAATPPVQTGCTGLNGASGEWTGIASSPTGKGFFMVSSNGGVVGCGDAQPIGGLTSETLNAPVVGMAATTDGKGYWLVASDGGVFAVGQGAGGDALLYGSMGGTHLNQPVVGIAATADGRGYWLAAADGGVFSFGDAPFRGSMAGTPLVAPVVGITAASPSVPA
jgi:hypothetical protein